MKAGRREEGIRFVLEREEEVDETQIFLLWEICRIREMRMGEKDCSGCDEESVIPRGIRIPREHWYK